MFEFEQLPEGIRYSDNRGAKLLEEHLEVLYFEFPKVVELDTRNNSILYHKDLFLRKLLGLNLSDKPRLQTSLLESPVGVYLPSHNAYITTVGEADKKRRLVVDLHENAHALLHQVNPSITARVEDFLAKLGPDKKITEVNQLPEEVRVLKLFHEGFAEWSTAEIIGRIKRLKGEKLDEFHMVKILDRATDALVIKSRGQIDHSSVTEFLKEAKREPYVGGHFFYLEATDYLLKEGLELPNALFYLLQNPPKTWVDVSNPEKYLSCNWGFDPGDFLGNP